MKDFDSYDWVVAYKEQVPVMRHVSSIDLLVISNTNTD